MLTTKRLRQAARDLSSNWLAQCLDLTRAELAGEFAASRARVLGIIRMELRRRGIDTSRRGARG